MEKRKIRLFVAGCVLFLIGSAWLLFYNFKIENSGKIYVFPDSGFYREGMTVTVRMPSGKGTVYYTVDGKKPSEDWGNVREYTEPLALYAEPEGSAYSFLFFTCLEDGTLLEQQERNYLILGEGRYLETDYVVCVQGDEDSLFGYEDGIFVRGRRWDEYMAENPGVNPQHVLVPANYYEETELEVHAAVFDRDGGEIISQECGIKIYGRAARVKNQKSFRLIARHSYDEVNEFTYPFFSQLISDSTGENIQEFQRLSLHNSGQDNGYGFIRNTLCCELAGQSGFPDVLVSRSAAVYINGCYQGVYWLQNAYDDRYFREKYGFYEGEMAVCGNSMNQMEISEGQDPLERQSAEEYNSFCIWLRDADINDDKVWEKVTKTIDVDNLLHYAAIEYYVNNYDWAGNVKVYRYMAADGEEYREGTVFDGRYRYLLYDLDYGMGLIFFGWIGRDVTAEVLQELCDPDQYTMIFARLMERKECRDAFINQVINLGNNSFSKENVDWTLETLNASRWAELEYMMGQTDILKDSIWESDDNSIEDVVEEMQVIRRFAEDRRANVLSEMMRTWDCGALFQAEAEGGAVEACINGQPVSENSWYFAGIPITLSVKANSGIEVKGYEVNGKYIEGSEAEILAEEYLGENEKLIVVPDYEIVDKEQLSICYFSINGTQDSVVLENTGSTNIHLEDYFLSDDYEEILKGRLPNIILEPGERITVYGSKYEGRMERGSCQVDFSWAKEEPVILSHLTEGIVECRNCP